MLCTCITRSGAFSSRIRKKRDSGYHLNKEAKNLKKKCGLPHFVCQSFRRCRLSFETTYVFSTHFSIFIVFGHWFYHKVIQDTLLIQTPHYHGQFALSLGKESPLTFSLNSIRLIRTLSAVPSVLVLTGFDCWKAPRPRQYYPAFLFFGKDTLT